VIQPQTQTAPPQPKSDRTGRIERRGVSGAPASGGPPKPHAPLGDRWCRERNSNPHSPFGPEDFKRRRTEGERHRVLDSQDRPAGNPAIWARGQALVSTSQPGHLANAPVRGPVKTRPPTGKGCNSLLRKSLAAKRRRMRKGIFFVFLAFLAAVIHSSRFAGIKQK
jgi:hypothetical protein